MDKDSISMLRRVGLNEYESRAYLSLLRQGVATASEISDMSGIPRPRAYDILEGLSKRGFVSQQPGRPVKFKGMPVDESFEFMKKQRTDEMHKEFKEIDKISERLRSKVKEAPESKEHDSPVWVLKNRENIYSKMDSLINNASESILIASSETGLKRKLEAYGDSLRQAKKRGVNITIVTPTETEHTKKAGEYATVIKKAHDQRMFIADDNVLLFLSPEHEEKKEMGAWIKSPHFANSQRKFMQKCEF